MEMKAKIEDPVVVYEDNQSVLAITKNEGYEIRAKRIEIRYHLFRDAVKAEVIHLEYIKIKSQLVDFLTQIISIKTFQFLVAKSNVADF